jgi:deoxycytidylate deaminase
MLSRRQLRYFELAKKVSVLGEHPQHKIGCILVINKTHMVAGYNSNKTDPNSPSPFKSSHAEFRAITSTREDLKGASIYVYREDHSGNLALSFPCENCLRLIKQKGIRNIYFTDYDGFKHIRL